MKKFLIVGLVAAFVSACTDPVQEKLEAPGLRALTAEDVNSLNRATFDCTLRRASSPGTVVGEVENFILDGWSGPLGRGDYIISRFVNGDLEQLSFQRVTEINPGEFSVEGLIRTSGTSAVGDQFSTIGQGAINSVTRAVRYFISFPGGNSNYVECGAPQFIGQPKWF